MSKLNHVVLAILIGAAPALYAQNQPAEPSSGDPNSASSPHQREATGQTGTAEAPTTESPEAGAAASPHQKEAVGESSGNKMKMAGMGPTDPATFVKKAALGGMTEVETSKLAVSKAQDPKVRSFAQQMVRDHSAANEELKSLAARKGWTLPTSLDAEHKGVVQKLSAKSGVAFDEAYSKQMMEDHEKTVAMFEAASKSSDKDLAQWVTKTLPTIEQHEQLASTLPGASHSASAAPGEKKY
jgi:putative membrane protein